MPLAWLVATCNKHHHGKSFHLSESAQSMVDSGVPVVALSPHTCCGGRCFVVL